MSGKQIDWFGAYIIGLVTAIGGGTIRDLLLDVTPFWMLDGKYFLTTAAALLVTILFKEKVFRWGNTLYLFDAIGLGLFTIVGISKSLDAGLPFWVCIIMGAITGSVARVALCALEMCLTWCVGYNVSSFLLPQTFNKRLYCIFKL